MQYLRAGTETKVVIGPVVAVGDGFTPVTTLAVSSADEAELLKHDAAAVTDISGNTFAAIAGADGYYNLTLTVGQLDTEGRLTVLINDDSLCLPVRHDFVVQNANVYDSLHAAAATDYLQTDAVEISGSSTGADNMETAALAYSVERGLAGTALPAAAADAAGGLPISDAGGLDLDGVLSGNTPQTGDSFARLGAPAGASVSADIADVPTVSEFNARTLLAADYFDPASDTVVNVTTVGTTTNLTNLPSIPANWLTAAGIAASALDGKGDWSTHAATDIVSGGAITTSGGAVSNVTTVATTTTNTDMRGTDSAYTGTPPTAAAIRAEIDSNSTEFAQLIENSGYTLAILAGTISNANTATETYVITAGAVQYTAAFAGLDSDGNRDPTVLSKV